MELTFLGGASEVGRLGVVADIDGARLLLDYGMAPTDPPQYPDPAPPVDLAVLTHGHLDHVGMMPWIAGRHGVPILGTGTSRGLAPILTRDSLKVARLENYPQPYSHEDVRAMEAGFREARYGDETAVGGCFVALQPAGHIPGSAMAHVRGGSASLLFTGDLNTEDTRLVRGAEAVSCDVLVMESTYGGQEHPPRREEERRFIDAVDDAVRGGHTAVVPAFATGRSQEVLMLLVEAGFEPYLDGMGKAVARVFQDHPEHLRAPQRYRRALSQSRPIRRHDDRKRALRGGEVIITTSGMLEGGPALFYIGKLHDDPGSAVLLTGYQVEGTNGRRLLDEGVLALDEGVRPVAGAVDRFHFSSHADHGALVRFVEACDPELVVLVHGENREALAEDLPGREVALPTTGDTVAFP